MQKLFSVKEKETLQQSLSKVQFLVFFMGCKDILQIYTNQLESIFYFEVFPKHQFNLPCELLMCVTC